MEKKNQHDIYARKLREKERDLRNLKKTELQLKVANEGLAHTQVSRKARDTSLLQVTCILKDLKFVVLFLYHVCSLNKCNHHIMT